MININSIFSQYSWKKVSDFGGLPVKLFCIDSVNCIALLRNDIYQSKNGGYDWELLIDETDDRTWIYGISYPDTNHIIVLYEDEDYDIIKYNNQGVAWDSIRFVDDFNFKSSNTSSNFYMVDSLLGLFCFKDDLVITNDGWHTYKILNPNSLEAWHLHCVKMIDSNNYCCVSDSLYFYTDNNGLSFESLDFDIVVHDIFFLNDSIGYLVGDNKKNQIVFNGRKHAIYKTTSHGRKWDILQDTVIDNFKSAIHLHMLNENEGMFVGSRGLIVHTVDGFKTFTREYIEGVDESSPYLALTYSGNTPIIAAHNMGIYIRIDTIFQKLPTPILISPKDTWMTTISDIRFNWTKDKEIDIYIFQLARDSKFTQIISNDTLIGNNMQTNMSNQIKFPHICGLYHWRAGAFKQGTVRWSETWSFSLYLNKPSLLIPKNNSTDIEFNTDLAWKEINGADRYHLQCSFNSDFNDLSQITH